MEKLSNVRAQLAKQSAKVNRQWLVPAVVAVVGAGILILVQAPNSSSSKTASPASATAKATQTQVDSPSGTSHSGHGASSQPQTSLAAAASAPTGAGSQYVDKPAAGVGENHSSHHTSADVYGDPKQTGIGTNGCYIDYGIPGEQCLPAHAATNGTLTCVGVRKYFPSGIKVSGTDRFTLDTNHDTVACNSGD
jgi:hypothetical protein